MARLGPNIDGVAGNGSFRAGVPLQRQNAGGGFRDSCTTQEKSVQSPFPAATEKHLAPFGSVGTLMRAAASRADRPRHTLSVRQIEENWRAAHTNRVPAVTLRGFMWFLRLLRGCRRVRPCNRVKATMKRVHATPIARPVRIAPAPSSVRINQTGHAHLIHSS